MAVPEVLVDTINQLSLLETESDNWIDGILEERRPRKRVKPTDDERRTQLEEEFLTPSHAFSTEWLNKLQQYVDAWFLGD
jgi:antiviral helicase SKI2